MNQDWIFALIGGGLIGLAATIHLLLSGRISGISGIFFGVIRPQQGEFLWRIKFVIGLILGGLIGAVILEQPFVNLSGRSLAVIGIAGFLVGFGTKLGSGCTSGHGVCGISRLSIRSIAATVSFMAAGIITVFLYNLMSGGN